MFFDAFREPSYFHIGNKIASKIDLAASWKRLVASWKRLEAVLGRVSDVGSARGAGNTVPGAAGDALGAARERRRRLWSRVWGWFDLIYPRGVLPI